MPTNDELKNLRAIVRKRRAAVTAKASRIKRNTGLDVKGTKADPRRPLDVVDRYNRVQLNKYLSDLNGFMARDNGFVAGANGSVITKKEWLDYKKVERQVNRIGAIHFADIANTFIPVSGITIRQREATIKAEKVRGAGEIVVTPYSHIERDAADIKDANALKKLKAGLKKKLDKNYLPLQIAAGREQLNLMLDTLGNNDLKKDFAGLTDNQFDILWNHTSFATNVSSIYFVMKSKNTNSHGRWHDTVVEDYRNDIRELFDWAKALPAERASADQRRSAKVNNAAKSKTRKR